MASAATEASKSSPRPDRNGVAFELSLPATNNSMSNGAKLAKAIWYCGAAALFAGMLVARNTMAASHDMPRETRELIMTAPSVRSRCSIRL
jgi:hypothetical protein